MFTFAKHSTFAALLALMVIEAAPLLASEPSFETVAPLLKTYCVACHSGDEPKGELDLGKLSPNFATNAAVWKNVFERLNEDSMPPKNKPQPTVAERRSIVLWVASGLAAHQAAQAKTEGRARHRRLNRIEYVNTIRDLLGATVDIETLPEDGVANGFDNVDAALDLSSTLLERYLETADAALDALFVKGPAPERKKLYTDFGPTPYPEPGLATIRRATQSRVEGLYKFRFEAQAFKPTGQMTLLIYVGSYGSKSPANRLIGGYDVFDTRTTIEVTAQMGTLDSIRVFPFETVKHYGRVPAADAEPGLIVHSVEVDGPIHDAWPPAPTTWLFGNRDLAQTTAADAQAILRKFTPRAFRRPVSEEELTPFFELFATRIDKSYSFEAALRVALKAVLCSPDFLYLSAAPGKLNDFDLASRLSYFLWSSTPDEELLEHAARGLLTSNGTDEGERGRGSEGEKASGSSVRASPSPSVCPSLPPSPTLPLSPSAALRAQVERMLADPKAAAFTVNFTGQWLSLRHLQATTPDKNLYPDFDDLLEISMPRETHLFFEEILKGDRSALEFLHSDWSMLNERLAMLYGISGVKGNDFRKVMLPADSHRGGVMTQAAILKVTANGTSTSPVVRGAWVLSRMLGTPAPRPPKDVPAIEPDVRGAVTIREQLAKHKAIESCAACHAKIDPPGNALENFDVIGGWRETYRTSRVGPRKIIPTGRGRTTWMHFGAKVEAADELAGGRAFADVDGFKKLLLDDPDQFARGLSEKIMVYATGHELELADRATIESIVADVKRQRYGFRAMIHAIVQSETFRHK